MATSSAKVVETVKKNPGKRKKKKKFAGASGVNIVAKFRSMSFAAMRVETYRYIWIRTASNSTVGVCKVDEESKAANGYRHQGKETECVCRSYTRRIYTMHYGHVVDLSVRFSIGDIGIRKGCCNNGGDVRNASVLPPVNCTSGCTPSCLFSSRDPISVTIFSSQNFSYRKII